MSLESVVASVEDAQADVIDSRNSAMGSMEDLYEKVTPVENVSNEINTLLADDSEYLQEARQASREAREEAGFLESGFTEGVGETAAIDKVYDIAAGNIYADIYNSAKKQDKYMDEYQHGYSLARRGQDAMDALGYEQVNNAYDLELADQEFGYEKAMEDIKQSYTLDNMDALADYRLDRIHFGQSNQQLSQMQRQDTFLMRNYQNAYLKIMSADLDPEDKLAQLNKATELYQQALDENRIWQEVQGNPYNLDNLDRFVLPVVDAKLTEQGGWYTGRLSSDKWYDIFTDVKQQIKDQTDSKVRGRVPGYSALTWIRDEWPAYQARNPIAADKITRWANDTQREDFSDDYAKTANDWQDLAIAMEWQANGDSPADWLDWSTKAKAEYYGIMSTQLPFDELVNLEYPDYMEHMYDIQNGEVTRDGKPLGEEWSKYNNELAEARDSLTTNLENFG